MQLGLTRWLRSKTPQRTFSNNAFLVCGSRGTPLISSPRFIFNENGFLNGPDSEEELRPKTLAEAVAVNPIEPRDPNGRINQFLDENAALFGHSSEILGAARISREYVTAHNGLRTVVWEQQLDGIPVFEAVLYGHIAKNGELASLSSQFLPALAAAADAGVPERQRVQETPTISARQAVALAAANIGETLNEAGVESIDEADRTAKRQKYRAEVLKGDAETSLVWLPMNRQTMRLCWRVVLMGQTRGELFQVLVDAETGEPQVRHCWTSYANPVAYRVFPSDSPSPFSPGHSTPLTNQPSLTNRALTNLVAISTNASPAGWIGVGRSNTIGNNVDAHLDLSDENPTNAAPVDPPRPIGTTNNGVLTFDFALDLTNSAPTATNNQKSAVVNAFYWCNWIHDRLYDLGFTEAAGNFQQTNFNRGGSTNGDPVLVDVQNGAAVGAANTAGFSAQPQDGTAARIELLIWNGPSPDRDCAFDAEVMLHEYTHLLSTRRVGHGTGISIQGQPAGLAEGWSDFMAMCLLSESGDAFSNAFAYGAYSTYLWTPYLQTLNQNYHYGMRRYPYSTDLAKNPLTFNDLDELDHVDPPAVTVNPALGLGYSMEPHNAGEIWAVALCEILAKLVTKHGFTEGRETILRLVMDGMSLCPPNPTFLQARDAVILADRVNSGGANLNEIWAGFAKRGMGWSAPELEFYQDFWWITESAFDLPPANEELWYYTTGNAIYSSPAIGMDGTIYFGSTDGKLYALTPGGAKKWEFAPSGSYSFNSSPTIGPDGTIYARRNSGYLYAVNPNGTQKWSYPVYYDTYASPTVALDGTIYIAGTTNLIALYPDGTLKWTFPTGNTIYSSPAIGPDGTIYFGGMDNKVHAVTPSGSAKGQYWPFVANNSVASSPAIAPDGTVYVGSHDGKLYALNTNGTLKWASATNGIIDSSPAIGPDGTVYVGSQNYRIYGYLPDGTVVGPSAQTGHYIRSSPAVAADGTVYVGSYDGKLYAYNANLTSKGTNWPFSTSGQIFSSPTVGSDGTVYFGSGNYKLYALRGLSGPAHSSWPMFRRDARHVGNLGNITLHSAHFWSNNLVQFQVLASPALANVEVQSSEDLTNWSSATVVPLVNGSATCLDSPSNPPKARFYRAKNGAYLSMNPIGYMTNRIAPGYALIANQLNTTNNTVSGLMPNVPNGTLVLKWNETTQQYNTNTFSTSAGWSTNMTLLPGEGAWIGNVNASSNDIVLMFVGEVLQGHLANPIPSGFSLRSSMVPQSGGVSTVLGYNAGNLDTIQGFSGGEYEQARTYYTGSGWDTEEPEFGIGVSFTIIPGAARTWARSFSVWP